ncbi:uncharacterized protein [Epargyreus clarus]|uniref:uncharacterized protein n=1 Tax=Epargyreus clarus TaxID=520877 RepID=UPI003C2E1A89
MYYKIQAVVVLVLHIIVANDNVEKSEEITVNDIADTLISVLGVSLDTPRFKDLKNKLKQIDGYVIDKDKYVDLLRNQTVQTNLNETNFHKAMLEKDHFQFLLANDSKNLYLRLKERMNRDDILKIISERGQTEKIVKSARRMMGADNYGKISKKDVFDSIIDKFIGETPNDNHDFQFRKEDNKYWDPQNELEDLKEYHKHDGRRIYKGERTTIRHYPFMVSVHVMGRFWCGGVLYWHDLVLTSAACLQLMHNNRYFRENPRVLEVRIGSNHSRIGGETVEALEVYFHPSYNPRTLQNNIAVIRLRRDLAFSYHRIPKIIDISHSSGTLAATAEVLLLGWGVSKMSQRMAYEPIFLNRKFLPVYPNVFCKEVYGDKFVTETNFCAGTMTTGEGACDHDAGGPAILAGRLVGIISFGPTVCGYPNAPTVFTLVGAYADWIETINETMPGYYRGKKKTTTSRSFTLFRLPQMHRIEDFTETRPEYTTPTTTTEVTFTFPTETTTLDLRGKSNLKGVEDTDGGWSIELN